jgi:hypothetical protein
MIEVHPLAAVFPMMTDDELQDLAADIREHGLLHPIVLDADGVLIDGRNRLRACEIAEREPQFERLNGHDAAAFIVSANLNRRNLTIGQQAMALAMIYPDPARGRGKKDEARKGTETGSFSYTRVKDARLVLHHSPALAADVMAKRCSLDKALEKITEERRISQSADTQMAELRAEAPDLADLVDEERLPLAEAHATLVERRNHAARSEANKRENMLRLSEAAWHAITAWASTEFVAELTERMADADFSKQWLMRVRPDPARINDILAGAKAFALVVKERSNV